MFIDTLFMITSGLSIVASIAIVAWVLKGVDAIEQNYIDLQVSIVRLESKTNSKSHEIEKLKRKVADLEIQIHNKHGT